MKWLSGTFGGAMAFFLHFHPVVQALFALALLDLASGLLKAIHERRLNSDISLKGVTRKAGMFLIVAVAWIAEHKLTLGLPADITVFVAGFYCTTEIISVLENIAALGLPLPDVFLEKFRKKN